MVLKSPRLPVDAVTGGQEVPEMADATETPLAADDRVVDQLTARLMSLDLDAQTLELLMAALTVEACDHIDLPES
jgi:hypothetical protein